MKLAIDPGHGMGNRSAGVYDPGACAGGASEADIVLDWALTLKWVLGKHGIPVWLTRDDDRDADPVGQRDDRAELAGCTHFLSLHCNAGPMLATGVECFYRDVADRDWALKVLRCGLQATKLRDRGVKSEGQSQHKRLAVFDFDGPACLLETGFITNGGDRRRLLARDVRLDFAERVAEVLKGMRG